jgi:hypothetical protein
MAHFIFFKKTRLSHEYYNIESHHLDLRNSSYAFYRNNAKPRKTQREEEREEADEVDPMH